MTPSQSRPERLQIRLFGGAEIASDGVPLRRTRTRTEIWLLAALLLRANRNVERVWLAGVFWPESRPEMALNNLRRSLSNLRQVLGDESYRLLSPAPHTIAFDLADAFCDVTAFDNALARRDNASLRRAVELYRGPLLPECDSEWLLSERQAREHAFITALEALAQQAFQNGDTLEAVRFLRQILRVDPFRETTHRVLLETLASVGDKAGMTLVYRQLRLLLHDELQSEPSAETKALYQRLQERVSTQGTTTSLPPRSAESDSTPMLSPPPLRIPFPVSDLIGREAETQEVSSVLATHRLITLTGSGGIGKTRLALSVATLVALDFPAGIWFVDLSPITDPAQLVSTIARALEVREHEDRSLTDALLEHLRGRRLLLILDNAEHILESCAALTARLLETLPDLQVLVTSRMPLGVAGEQIRRVPSLPYPDNLTPPSPSVPDSLLDYAGPRLFVTRALSASSAFVLTERNAPAILQICARLDGIPLALELAAARVAILSAEQIAARLEDAFRLLTTGPRTALPRHQTLRALVDWSYDLLSNEEKILLARLSIFVGGWILEAAESVCGFAHLKAADVLDCLSSLVDKSLVLAEETDGTMRYRMLETLRQYGAEKRNKSGETAEVRQRHRDYFLILAEAAYPKLRGFDQANWLSVLEREHDNLRQAIIYCLENSTEGEAGLRLGVVMHHFWGMRGHLSEGREFLTLLLSHSGAQSLTIVRADALFGAGLLEMIHGDYATAGSLYGESLAIFQKLEDKSGVAFCRMNLGNLARIQGDYPAARSRFGESLALLRELGDRNGIAASLNSQGNIAREQGDYAVACSLYEESLAIYEELGDRHGIAYSLNNLGHIARNQGAYTSAHLRYTESQVIFRELGDRGSIAYCLGNLGIVARDQGNYASARSLNDESLAIFRELGDRHGIAFCLGNLGVIARDRGDYTSARLMYEESVAIYQELGVKGGIAGILHNLANIALEQGDSPSAHSLFRESLTIFGRLGDKRGIASSLEAFASVAANAERGERSVRLWGAAFALREALSSTLSPLNHQKRENELAVMRASLGEVAFAAAWKAGRAMTWEQAVANALED